MMRRLGLVCFAIGVILFFADRYLISVLHFFTTPFSHDQSAAAAVLGTYYVVQLGGLALIVAGATMFIAARRRQKVAASS